MNENQQTTSSGTDFLLVRRKPTPVPWVHDLSIQVTGRLAKTLRAVSRKTGHTEEEVASVMLESTEAARPTRLEFGEVKLDQRAGQNSADESRVAVRSILVPISRKMHRKLMSLSSLSGLDPGEVAQAILETTKAPKGLLADIRARLAKQRGIDLQTPIAARIPPTERASETQTD